jgi:HEAT repeat protein
MKKIQSILLILLLSCGTVLAQSPSNRTTTTIIADILAQIPAQNKEQYVQQQKDLLSTGESGILQLAKMLNTSPESTVKAQYALNGLTTYTTEIQQETARLTVVNAYLKALDELSEVNSKAFIISLLRIIAKDEAASKLMQLLDDKALSSPAVAALASIKGAASQNIPQPIPDNPDLQSLFSALKKAKPREKVEILNKIAFLFDNPANRNHTDASCTPTLADLLASDNREIKTAAATVLMQIGGPEAIAALAKLLNSTDEQDIRLGKEVLLSTKGDIASGIVPFTQTATNKGKIAILQLLSARKADAQSEAVFAQLNANSSEVKTAAYEALKDVVTGQDLPDLYKLMEQNSPETLIPVQQAIVTALKPLPEEKRFQTISAQINRTDKSKKWLYYSVLATSGNINALNYIVEKFNTETGKDKDAAFQALLEWKGIESADELLAIGEKEDANHSEKALNRYIQLASSPSLAGENRRIFLTNAIEIAKTDTQKKKILKQLGQTNSYLGLLLAGNYLDNPSVQQEAAGAVMNIALNNTTFTGKNVKNLLEKTVKILDNPDADYQREAIRKKLNEMPDEEGFISIFNGKDLTGWKGSVENPLVRAKMKPAELAKAQAKADEQMRKDWKVENGLLIFDGTGYDNICTEKQYDNFEMYVDWRLEPSPEADAGIYLRGTPQVQIWNTARTDAGAQVGSGGLYNNQSNPSNPIKPADNRLGEWNSFYIQMKGDRVTVFLNGKLVVDNVILENYWDRSQPIFPVEQIELQAHGSKVYYRNIYMKELKRTQPFELSEQEKKESYKILFDGTNMHEWTGNLVDYQLEDGCISVHPTSSFGGNLYTKKEYDNFVFRFEFQLTPSANNGVGIRAPMEGDNAYNAMEIQILDCEHSVYKDIAPYQHHGSVYGIIAAEHGAMKPVGEWNEEEIYANGDRIRVTLNGKVILDGNIREAVKNGTIDHQEHPGLFNKSGHIGFLGHGNKLKFRNIRIKELK